MWMWEPIWMAFLYMQITEYDFNVLVAEANCCPIGPVSSLWIVWFLYWKQNSPSVSILDTSGMALTDPTLLYLAVGKGIRTFTFCFHTPEKSDTTSSIHTCRVCFFFLFVCTPISAFFNWKTQNQSNYAQTLCGLFYLGSLGRDVLTSALRQVRSWQEVIFFISSCT